MASNTSTLTMSTLINEVLDELHQPVERPRQSVLTAAAGANDTTVTVDAVSADAVAATDVLEFGRELMLVTAVSGQTVTVSRGYLGTTAAAQAINTVGTINPQYTRVEIDRAIRQCFQSLVTTLPNICSEDMAPASANGEEALLPLHEDCMEVLDVRYADSVTNRVSKLRGRGQWRFEDYLPASLSHTGKALVVPYLYRGMNLIVTYQKNYAWKGEGEAATIEITVGGENLPVLFAVAKLQTGREVTRQELTEVEEWPAQINRERERVRLLQTLWGRYYQRLEEVVSTLNVPRVRRYEGVGHRF